MNTNKNNQKIRKKHLTLWFNVDIITLAFENARQCWNRQTGTFEGRVSLTYGFKSRLPHQIEQISYEVCSIFYAKSEGIPNNVN